MKNALRFAVAAALSLVACGPNVDPAATAEIRGAWVTDAPAYADRGFDITADSISLHQGSGIVVRYPITEVERVERGGGIEYTVRYESVVQEFDFRFVYHAGEQPTVTLPRQPGIVWTRAKS